MFDVLSVELRLTLQLSDHLRAIKFTHFSFWKRFTDCVRTTCVCLGWPPIINYLFLPVYLISIKSCLFTLTLIEIDKSFFTLELSSVGTFNFFWFDYQDSHFLSRPRCFPSEHHLNVPENTFQIEFLNGKTRLMIHFLQEASIFNRKICHNLPRACFFVPYPG